MVNDTLVASLVGEALNAQHPPRRKAAELLLNAVLTDMPGGSGMRSICLANPGLSNDVRAQIADLSEGMDVAAPGAAETQSPK